MYTDVSSSKKEAVQEVMPQIEVLFDLYADDVLRVCMVYLKKRHLAEDAFQDVFVKVCQKADSYRGDTPVLFWLLSIARNTCKDYLRSTWFSRVVSYDEWTQKRQAEPMPRNESRHGSENVTEEVLISHLDQSSALRSAVYALSPKYKDVILLRFYFDLSNDEIARQLGIQTASVRSRLFRAKQKLSQFMDRED